MNKEIIEITAQHGHRLFDNLFKVWKEPMNGDEVDVVVNEIRDILNILNGNT